MKVSMSVPDDVVKKIERIARRRHRSRNDVFVAALREYVARHVARPSPDEITEAWNRVCADVEQDTDFVNATARRLLEKVEW
jgi:predicted transcriptional regulator